MDVRRGYKQTEVGLIPEDWDTPMIGSLTHFKSGNGISVAALRQQSFDAPVPVYPRFRSSTQPLVHEIPAPAAEMGPHTPTRRVSMSGGPSGG